MNIVLLSIALILAITSLSVKQSIASLISFALMMLVLGLYYIGLDEKLLGLFQIFVYTGGIAVLMLFGITLIGTEFPKTKRSSWSGVLAFFIFILMSAIFLINSSDLKQNIQDTIEKKELFAAAFSDVVILFALIGVSLLYGTIKMMRVLKPKRRDNV
ncbi:MAG: NADH-quinone oxidoreductase subunit J [Sulfurimonas sp.]